MTDKDCFTSKEVTLLLQDMRAHADSVDLRGWRSSADLLRRGASCLETTEEAFQGVMKDNRDLADEIERLNAALALQVKQEAENWRRGEDERNRLREALEMIYDKWENGDPCYEDADPTSGFMGNAFQLSSDEENQILALLPRERSVPETTEHNSERKE
jgi:hypothetical protein